MKKVIECGAATGQCYFGLAGSFGMQVAVLPLQNEADRNFAERFPRCSDVETLTDSVDQCPLLAVDDRDDLVIGLELNLGVKWMMIKDGPCLYFCCVQMRFPSYPESATDLSN